MIKEYPNTRQFALALRRELEIAKAWLAGKKKRVLKMLKLNAADEALDILSMIEQLAGWIPDCRSSALDQGGLFLPRPVNSSWRNRISEIGGKLQLPRYQKAAMYGASASALAAFPGVPFDDSSLLDAQELYTLCLRKYPNDSKKTRCPARSRSDHASPG